MTLYDLPDEQAKEISLRFDPLRERLDETDSTAPCWLPLCHEVARGYRILYMPNETKSALIRWVKSYHCPVAAEHRRKVNGTNKVELLLKSAAAPLGFTMLAPTELRLTRSKCNKGAADWLRSVIIERDTQQLKDLIMLIEQVLPESVKLHDKMKVADIPLPPKESRCYAAQTAHDAFLDFVPAHRRLPGKKELKEAVEKRRGGHLIQESQWSATLKELGLGGLPRVTIRRRA